MKRILQILEQVAKVLLVTAVLLWVCDWAVYRLRVARGTAFDSVQVEEYLSTALKGNKQEYDYMGTAEMSCARAIFPHGGAPACWWLRRHTTQWE
ncbi:MAG TPA: hypothetical protein VHZ25_15460 [Acidobacteriaceae bacterium]|jgi:hypothetical protein|nr:hypothetical protein [Acidobacteriaceae bacterium]